MESLSGSATAAISLPVMMGEMPSSFSATSKANWLFFSTFCSSKESKSLRSTTRRSRSSRADCPQTRTLCLCHCHFPVPAVPGAGRHPWVREQVGFSRPLSSLLAKKTHNTFAEITGELASEMNGEGWRERDCLHLPGTPTSYYNVSSGRELC